MGVAGTLDLVTGLRATGLATRSAAGAHDALISRATKDGGRQRARCGPAWVACTMFATAFIQVIVPVSAQVTAQDNYDSHIRDRTSVVTIDEATAFGDKTDINSGQTSFYVTVASLPGNSQLEVALRYKYVPDRSTLSATWVWERDDPYISGDFPQETGWVLGESTMPSTMRSTARCSGTGLATGAFMPPALSSSDGRPGYWYPYEYYNGIHLSLPRGEGGLLIPGGASAITLPSQGGPYHWATNDGWIFSCIPLKNGPGEGFLGLAPDGTRYYFDEFRQGPSLPAINKRNVGGRDIDLYRREYRIYASRVEDRFGNYVEDLTASDGRSIIMSELPGGKIKVSAGVQEWVVSTNPFTIDNPDGTKWKLIANWDSLQWRGGGTLGDPGPYCSAASRPHADFTGSANVVVTTPSGATATFDFLPVQRGYSYVPRGCYVPEGALDNGAAFVNPKLVTEISLVRKTISGPGIATRWAQMTYGPPNDCFAVFGGGSPGPGECTSSSPTTVATTLRRSDGTYTKYTFGNRSYVNQGQLLKMEEGSGSETPIRVTNQEWQLFPPVRSGMTGLRTTSASLRAVNRMTVVQRDIIQQDRKFTWRVARDCGSGLATCVDQFIRPTKVERTSAPTP